MVSNEKNNKLIKRVVVPGYIQFFICILFWIIVGIRQIDTLPAYVYITVCILLLCSIAVIFFGTMLQKFYLNNIHETLENMEHLNITLRSQRHEYLNEMQVVYGLLELEEYEEAYNYLKPVYEDIAKTSKALKTSKPAVNALLQAKLELAEKKGIKFYIEVSSDLSQLNIEQWNLCKVIGNLLDNSITAVENNGIVGSTNSDKQVHINILEDSEFYIFIVYNNGPLIPHDKFETIFKTGYTSKSGNGHGFGLSIVKDIVCEEGGTITVDSNEKKTQFEVKLPKSDISI